MSFIATAATAAIGAGVSYGAGKLLGGGGSAGSGGGYDTFNPAPKPDKYSSQALDFASNNLNRLQEGKMPNWYDQAKAQQNQSFNQGLNQSFFGTEGNRGQGYMGQLDQMAAMNAMNPRALLAQKKKGLVDLQAQRNQWDQFMAGQDIAQGNTQQQGMMQTLMQGRNPNQQAIQFGGYPAQTPAWQQNMGGIDFSGAANSIGSGISQFLNPKATSANISYGSASPGYKNSVGAYTKPNLSILK